MRKISMLIMIMTIGEFPSRYRPLIWRFLLRLPENSESFQDYVQRGSHTAFEDLYNQYPIKSRKVFAKLQSTCNQIAHWSYVCAEVRHYFYRTIVVA
jgi:hypothetical protein